MNKISSYAVQSAVKYMQLIQIPRGKILFHQGDLSSSFYGVISGRIEIVRSNNAKDKEILIMTRESGECFGEWAILFNSTRTATARASEDTVMFKLEKDKFMLTLGVAV